VGGLAALHFAPTEGAARNLRRAGVDPERIHVTGNTVIDALQAFPDPQQPWFLRRAGNRRVVGVTLHRRENWGEAVDQLMQALIGLRDAFDDIEIVFVSHANPALAGRVRERLAGEARITVVDPLDYPDFIALLRASYLVLSDSGGVQEEAPAFGTPVLVLRETTERPEAVAAGVARLVGVQTGAILREAGRVLSDPQAHAAMARAVNPFGDGTASDRIGRLVQGWLGVAAEAPRTAAFA
jgi:UDP-N-acetylglucosamine 2-epimerase (non-hydrolysing)